MAFQRLRRAFLVLACAIPVLLAACGGGNNTVVSALRPTRLVAFGDGMADLGQVGGRRYTINDGTINVWTAHMAARYGLTLTAQAAGGTSYATGNARVLATPDAAGNSATPTVKAQIDSFLAAGSFGSSDLVVVSAGVADIVAETGANGYNATTRANIEKAGRDLAAQVRRLVSAGARYVVVTGPYNLGRSPWAAATGQSAALTDYSTAFTTALLVSIVDLGANVLYVDLPLYFNQLSGFPTSYGLTDASNLACTSVDAGAGIGIGTNQVNSALCTSTTLAAGLDVTKTMFADRLYPTPVAHRLFGDYAYSRVFSRW